MKTIEISVNDQDLIKLKESLNSMSFIRFIKIKEAPEVDPITLTSEQSLAEDWSSEEDSRYEKYFEA